VSELYEFSEEEFTTKFNGKVFLRILGHLRPYWLWGVGFLLLVAGTSIVDAYFTYLGKQMIDEGIMAGDAIRLQQLAVTYGRAVILEAFMVFGFIYLAGVLGERVQYDIRRKTFEHLQMLSFSYFDKTPVGWIMSRVTSDSQRIADLVTWGLVDTTWAILNICTSLFFMAFINWRLALVILVIVPFMVVLALWFKGRILTEYRKVRKLNSELTGVYNENISGVRVVKALVRERQNLAEFSEKSSNLYRAAYRAAWFSALFLPLVQLVGALAVGAVIWYGGLQLSVKGITLGGIQAFLFYLTFMMWPIQDLARVYAEMQQSIASAERIFSLIDAQPDVVDREGSVDPGTLHGDLVFDNVSFAYEEQGEPVLENFNLSVQQGEHIALVGPTGGGKSTIVNLLCRFYEPTSGTIRMGGARLHASNPTCDSITHWHGFADPTSFLRNHS